MQRTLNLLLIVTILLLGIAIVGCFLFFQMNSSVESVAHTQEVLYTQSEVYSRLQDMNLSARGFALTGEQTILEPYKDGVARLSPSIEQLQKLSADNFAQQRRVEALKEATGRFKEVTDSLIRTRSPQLVNAQKTQMDRIRGQLSAIVKEEQELLATRRRNASFFYGVSWTVLSLEILAGLGLLSACWKSINSYNFESRKQVENLEAEIDQRRRTEISLKATTLNLTRSNNDLQQFAYVASHDLQEPLRAITGFLTLLVKKQGQNLDEDSRTYIQHAVEGAERMRALVNDLLSYARVESKAQEFTTVDLYKIIETVKKDLATSINESNAYIETSDLPQINGDSIQLGQLFLNLIGNAIKFRSDAAPIIKIKAEMRADDWLFSVADNGRGFEMEHAERIFVIFQRLQGREQASGTGIGLALCKKIVERHGGSIWVEAKPNEGATFFFTIPNSTYG